MGTLPWYKSSVIIGALISAIAKLLVITGVVGEFTDADVEALTNLIILAVGAVGDIIAIVSRINQQTAPTITGGKGFNDVKCAPLAVAGALLLALMLGGCATVPLGDLRLKQVVVTSPSLCDAQARWLVGTATPQDLQIISLYDLGRLKLAQWFAKYTGQEAEVLADCAV